MTQFFSKKYENLVPYTPGEQPRDMRYVKLNTNESPFAPTKLINNNIDVGVLRLYPDPENTAVVRAYADYLGVKKDNVFAGNGSDEVLGFIFSAFFDEINKVSFPDITYGFYPVYCDLFGISKEIIPLKSDFTVDIDAFVATKNSVVIANPNAPTGITLALDEIEKILSASNKRLVVIDEAYIDFGGQSAVPLISKYDNLIVCHTFSKSRSLAGARLGFAIANERLIADIKAIKYSFNSYNVNRITEIFGVKAIEDNDYFVNNCNKIIANRNFLVNALKELNFDILDSKANFVLAKNNALSGKNLYLSLKASGVLVRYFDSERLRDYVRITVGSVSDINALLSATKNILESI